MHLMMTRTAKTIIAVGLVVATAIPTWAAPVPSNTAAVKTAAPIQTTEVRYFGYRGFGPGVAIGGLAFGLAGAALAAPYYYGYGYPGYYGYGYPGYAYGPNYYGYGYPGYTYGPNYYGYGPGYGYAPGPYAWGPRWHRPYRRW